MTRNGRHSSALSKMGYFSACEWLVIAVNSSDPPHSLFNHLFPSNPANISRINISQDGTLCAANITRFTTACEAIGLSHTELFGIHDVHEASESSLRRVAQTITTLAVLPVSSATASPGRASQPTSLNPLPSPSRKQSPVPIRVRRAPPDGPAISPLLIARPSAATGQRDSICSSKSHYELQAHMDQQGIELNVSSAWRTPTTSAFELPSETHKFADPESLKYALSRATTEPIVTSDLLPRSPSAPGSPSRSDTPNGQPSNTLLRPALRSRRTTGFKTQVSFADQSETLIEKTLQDPRVGSRLNGEGLEASRPGGGDVVGDPRVPDDARGLAHLRSLAALEGRSALPPLNSSDASPRHRPAVRRGQSLDVPSYWPETDSLLEEDEPRSAGDSSLVGGGARPSVIRRFSANGKVYVPRRSMSPTSQNASPITAGFPFNRSAPARSPSEHIDRRQSDGLSIALTSETSNEPMNMKIHSMINLSSPGGAPPLFRELSNSVLRTVPLQILEFNEPGLPPVKYVRRLSSQDLCLWVISN